MSNKLNYKQATNVERRTWDLETYEKKAKARAEAQKEEANKKNVGPLRQASSSAVGSKRSLGDDGDDDDGKEEFTPAAPDAAGPEKSERAFLKARRNKVDIDSKIGSTEMVSPEAIATTKTGDVKDGVTKTGVGWHCRVCDCFLKDSHTYLDHINGKKHQRKLGFSMRVERSTKDQVQQRLKQLAKQNGAADENFQSEINYENILKQKDEAERKKKEERQKRREERKKKARGEVLQAEEETEVETEGLHPDMAAMMGFGGFGGGNKNH